MKIRVSNNLKNLLSVLGANLFVMFAGIIQSFLLPSLLGPEQYGYWSMYLLYIGYAGLFNFGIADGIYLIYGGADYDELDKSKFKSYFTFTVLYLTALLMIWVGICLLYPFDIETRIIMMLIGVSCYLSCLMNQTVLLDQATSRFSIYSKGHIIEKIAIMVGILLLVFLKNRVAVIVVLFSILGKLITDIYYYSHTKPIITAKMFPINKILSDIKKFMFAGIWITLAAIGTTAMTNIGKSFVQTTLGVTGLGYYSFIFSLLGLFTIFFSAIATVLFPMMKRSTGDNNYRQMRNIDKLLNWFGIVSLLMYIPAKIILRIIYPKYEPALQCLIVLFPIAILLGKTSMVYSTTYKVERMERQYVYNLAVSIICCIIFNFFSLRIYEDVISPAIATYLAFLIWSILSTFIYNRNRKDKYDYSIIYNLISISSICINLFIKDSTLCVCITYLILIPSCIISTIKTIPVFKKVFKQIKK